MWNIWRAGRKIITGTEHVADGYENRRYMVILNHYISQMKYYL